jgi:hypothetical protein
MGAWDVVSTTPAAKGNPQPWDVVSHDPVQADAPQQATADPWAVVSHEPASPSFMDQVGGGIDSMQSSFQKTGALIADKVGADEFAQGLRADAAANDAEAAKVQYQSPHGESGIEQIKNLTNPDWWKATVAEAIPGSAPFLAGAAAGAAATPFPHPIAKLVGAGLGGGAAVFLQEAGTAYQDFKKVHPDDEEGAVDYAVKKAGLTGIVNAASIGLGPLGYGAGAIKHAIIQMAVQPAIGVGDTVSGNAMEQANIDPNTPLSRGVAKSAVGEVVADVPGTVAITRHVLNQNPALNSEPRNDATPAELDAATAAADQVAPKVPEPASTIDAQMDAFKDGRKPAVLVTPGEQAPEIPAGAKTYDTASGTLIYKDDAALAKALNPETLGEALGYGTGAKPANPTGAVVSKDAQGRIVAEQVTNEADDKTHSAVLLAAHKLAGEGGTVEQQPIEQVLQASSDAVNAEQAPSEDNGTQSSAGEALPPENAPILTITDVKDAGVSFRKGERELFQAGDAETIGNVTDRVNAKLAERQAQRDGFAAMKKGESFSFNAEVTTPKQATATQTQTAPVFSNETVDGLERQGYVFVANERLGDIPVEQRAKELMKITGEGESHIFIAGKNRFGNTLIALKRGNIKIDTNEKGRVIASGEGVRNLLKGAGIKFVPRKGGTALVGKKNAAAARKAIDAIKQQQAEIPKQAAEPKAPDHFTTPVKRTIKTTELPEDLHNVTAQTSLIALKGKKGSDRHTEYTAAKTGGDDHAAINVVERVTKDHKIEAIRKTLDPNKPIYIVPVINVEGKALNRLPVAHAYKLADKLGGHVVSSIVKTQGTPNTNEKADARLTKHIGYDGTIPDPNGQYIIADDNYTSGRTVMALFEHLRAQGADVKGITTLASSRYGYGIKPREGAIDKLAEHTGLNKSEMGAILGHEVEHLTNAEINTILRTSKRGAESFRSRFATQGNKQGNGLNGRDLPAEGKESTQEGLTLHPQKSGTLLVKGDREAIRSQLKAAGLNHKGIPRKDGLLFGKTQAESVTKVLESKHDQETKPTSEGMGGFDDVINDRNKAVKSLSWDGIKGFSKDKRRVLMGVLTNLQLADVYAPAFKRMEGGNPLTQYATWLQKLEAERNGALHEAELIDQRWDKLNSKEADQVGKLMNDATVYAVHPDQAFESNMKVLQKQLKEAKTEGQAIDAGREINNERQREKAYPNLTKRYHELSKDGKAIYRNVRDLYADQWNKTRDAMIERVARNIPDATLRKQSINEIRLAFMKAIQIGPYFPLSRFGDFVTVARKDGDYIRDHYSSSAQQKQAAEKYRKAGFTVSTVKGEEFSAGDIGNAPVFAQDVFALLEKYGLKQTDLADDINQLMLRMMPDMSALKHSIHRKRIKGYSGDARRAFAHTVFHGAHHLSRIMYADRMQNEINRIRDEIKVLQSGKPSTIEDGNLATDVLNEMKVRHEKIMAPNSHPLTSWLGSLGFIWYLGASPAAGIVNLTQTPLVTLPMLAGKHGWGKASKALMRAMKDYARAPFKAGTYEAWVSLDRSKLISKPERALMDELVKDGTLDITQAHALAQLSETDTRHNSKGELSRGRTKAMRYVGAFFHNAEVVNRQVSALAAYRLAKESGANHEDAVNQARKIVFDSHFNYASSNRPRYMKGDAVRTLTMFKQYSQHMTYALLRNFNQSFKGESPEVRKQARKTLSGILGMHALAAGTLGLPLAGVIFNALDLAFDDDDEPYDSKTAYRNWLADTFGTKAGEAIAKGSVNAYAGIELHSRVSLDELWLRSPDRDLSGKKEALYYMEQAAGPIGALFLNVWSGAGSIAEGHVERGFEKMVPKFVKDFARAARYRKEGVTTYRGDPIIDNTTPAEEAAQALGFAPARAGERYEARSAVKKAQAGINGRRHNLLNWYAESVRGNDTAKQREIMGKIARFNSKHPSRLINGKTLKRSLKMRAARSAQTDHGIYLPKNSKGLAEAGRFAE